MRLVFENDKGHKLVYDDFLQPDNRLWAKMSRGRGVSDNFPIEKRGTAILMELLGEELDEITRKWQEE